MKKHSVIPSDSPPHRFAVLIVLVTLFLFAGCLLMHDEQGPRPPEAILAEVDETEAYLSWPASRDTVEPITGYKAFAVEEPAKSCTTSGQTSCMITGLTAGKAYRFAVKARNRSGLGPASTPSQSFTISSVPPLALNWTPRSSGTTGSLNSVVWTGTQFVAVGDYGSILTSADGATWTPRSTGRTINLDHVASGNGRLIALGDTLIGSDFRSVIFTSVNGGVSWTSRMPAINFNVHRSAWGGGIWVLAGSSAMVLTSPDGESWTQRATGYTAPPPYSTNFADLTWTGSRFVLLPFFTDGSGPLSSPDGSTWSQSAAQNTAGLYAVASNENTILAAGYERMESGRLYVTTSNDGIAWSYWQTETRISGIDQVVWAGRWIIRETWGDIWTSRDGFWWVQRRQQNLGEIVPSSLAWSGTRLVLVGSFGKILTSP